MKRSLVAGGLALAFALSAPLGASAQVMCDTLPNPVYVSGSTAIKALLPAIAAPLYSATGAEQLTIVYFGTGACRGVSDLIGSTAFSSTATYWTDTTAAGVMTCQLPTGTHMDIALADTFPQTCPGVDATMAGMIHDSTMLVIPFDFIVAEASSEFYIDVRDAYEIYGLGPTAAMASPWTMPTLVFQRDMGSGTQATVGVNIHVPPTAFMATPAFTAGPGSSTSTGQLITDVATGLPAANTLGFASADAVDAKRAMLNILALRYWGQNDFWYPDSDDTTFDKRPTRDGHYALWGYEHVDYRNDISASRMPAVTQLVDVLTGAHAIPGGSDITTIESAGGVVPLCAMTVSRPNDGADFAVYTDANSCGCFFEEHAPSGAGTSGCTACTSDAMCTTAGTHCHHGFCE